MNLRTLMQAGPAKANELFTKLSETSDGAVKTRERLFAELKAELELHTSLEEQHLFPVLRRNAETKELVGDATRENRELRAKLGELDSVPKNDEAFLPQLKELQKLFRQHARDEKTEILPAVQRALSEEQVQGVTEKIEAGRAEAEQARQEEAEERRAQARQERERAEEQARQAEAATQEAEASASRIDEAARRVADATMQPMKTAVDVGRQATRLVASASETAGLRTASSLTNLFFAPWLGMMQGLQAPSPRGLAAGQEVIPLGEEVLEVSKRTENRGTARIHRYVVETPVERQVTLQSEQVVVERRRPTGTKPNGEILTEVTVEVVETAEVPVVEKRARLREQVVIRTERTQHVETVRGVVRRDEVDIQQPGRKQAGSSPRAVPAEQ
ncbi:DUF2382 domain-containing protein [Falsiroseomonas sp. HW251]|uniref:DUF2382 domain-containing protein n=1 Tax=Falsiroseomonas sp. HW251 TaxID=3390998 RepID=UPI003D3143C4